MPTNFNDSFRPVVPLRPDEPCSLKWHFTGILREIVGYCDGMAARDPEQERFVFLRIKTLLKHCNDFSDEKRPYGKAHLFRALDFLRNAVGVLSQVSKGRRPRANGTRKGFLVAPHDALFALHNGQCCYIGLDGQGHGVDNRLEAHGIYGIARGVEDSKGMRLNPEGSIKVYPSATEEEIAAIVARVATRDSTSPGRLEGRPEGRLEGRPKKTAGET